MRLIAIALLAISSPVSDVPVEVGRFDPSDFPEAVQLDRHMPHAEMVSRVEAIIAEGRCDIEGATDRRFNIVVPYALSLEPDGFANTVVVQENGCVPLETLVGQIVLAQLERGDFVPSHDEGDQWYVGEMAFAMNVQSAAASISEEDVDRMICRDAEAELGSRLREKRMCLTAAGWRQYEEDRRQLRRDISSAAKCGNDLCRSQ